MTAALLFVNGNTTDGAMLQRALDNPAITQVIAADGGARLAHKCQRKIDLLIGDMDSLTQPEIDQIAASGAEVLRFPPEKDETDLELALNVAIERNIRQLWIIGAMGSRIDQSLANIYLLALPQLKGCDVRLVDSNQETRLLHPGEHPLEGKPGDTVSLIPMGGAVTDIWTSDFYYPLNGDTLMFGPARGISNVINGAAPSVRFAGGTLLLVHTDGVPD